MYSENDVKASRKQLLRECIRLLACVLPPLAFAVAGFCMRRLWMAMVGAIVGGAALIFLIDMKLLPAIHYRRFLRVIGAGLRRTTAGRLTRVEEEPIYEEGLWLRETVLNVYVDGGEEGERLFWLDVAKPVPRALIGRDVALTSCDRFVVGLLPLNPEENDDEQNA